MLNSIRRPTARFLRRIFGGSSNASEFCNCSDAVCDITNELLHCEYWDPSEFTRRSKIRFLRSVDSSIPFAEALPLAVDVPANSIGKADNHFGDQIVGILGDPRQHQSWQRQAALALNSSAVHPTRKDPFSASIWLSFGKLLAEGRLEEVKQNPGVDSSCLYR
jgi:hypothetical protein